MKVQLVHPPVYVNPKAFTTACPTPPLGLAYVAAALEAAGHDVRVLDAVAEAPETVKREGRVLRLGLSPDDIVARIDPDTRVVGITNMWSFSWPIARDLVQRIKQARPEVVVVCGGEHFNGLPEHSMASAPIDYIVRGEGEETAVELLAALDKPGFDPSAISGIVWRDGANVVVNPPRARVREIDEIPWPAWHLFDLDTYNRYGLKNGIDYGTMVPILATRGCPYSCTYCSSPRMWGTRWVARNPTGVVDEIEHAVRAHGANNFPFQDLTIVIRRDWILMFCQEIVRRGLDIRWQLPSGTRCEVIDDEVAEWLRRSGCGALAYAPESGSDETRRLINKRMKQEPLFSAVDASVRHDLHVTCFLVIGFPHERDQEVRENFAFARRLAWHGVEDVVCAFFFPIPATQLFDELQAKGKISLEDESLLAPILGHDRTLTADRNFSYHLSPWRLTLYRVLIYLNFYTVAFLARPGRIFRLVQNLLADREESRIDRFLRLYLANLRRRLRDRWPLPRADRRRVPSGAG